MSRITHHVRVLQRGLRGVRRGVRVRVGHELLHGRRRHQRLARRRRYLHAGTWYTGHLVSDLTLHGHFTKIVCSLIFGLKFFITYI